VTIARTIQEFPKIEEFLTTGDTGAHPQHFVDRIAQAVVSALKENE
jgi:hypothetical protein